MAAVFNRFDQIGREVVKLLRDHSTGEAELRALASWQNPSRFSCHVKFHGEQFVVSIKERKEGAPTFLHIPDQKLLRDYCLNHLVGGCAIYSNDSRPPNVIVAPDFSDQRVMRHELAHQRGYGEVGARLFSGESKNEREALVDVITSEAYGKRSVVFSILEAYEGQLYDQRTFRLNPSVRDWFEGGVSYNSYIKPGIDSHRRLAASFPKLFDSFDAYLEKKLFVTGGKEEFAAIVTSYFERRSKGVLLHPKSGRSQPTEDAQGFLRAIREAGIK